MPYDARAYWNRLHDRDNLSAVGQSGMPSRMNALLYRALERRVRWFVRRHGVLPVARAFEVGAGTGYWVRVWHDLGAGRVDGCDLVEAAVERLDDAFADRGDRFVVSDIGAPDPGLPDERYGLVSVMNVLLHLVDDAAFERALGAVAGLVEPGGHLLLVEPILFDPTYERPCTPEQASRARPLAAYRDPLAAAGLELVEILGAVALANNPIEAASRTAYARYERWWEWLRLRARKGRITPWIGPVLLAGDRAALAFGQAPSSKVALFRRTPAP
jgi:SAM-dependent methyltransferase